ncbi:sodium/glutamate symporter [Alkalilimnicola sp. S0819]|uniref:sodium/glutamate symporter n=1 Tax=Alkalilimnicola sp. S0819 TaxID=2613922 RepID=UPI001261DE41|nr:sodium:glutamate symporter [Alkalilimnicola sp. S0819]KAB7627536.1 sodium:glutamate symporter [Alkalilimnicola sp. S0819]MPQ15690.1 sodium:glutamate symporter [Alkalilimnicola sp. S0819]
MNLRQAFFSILLIGFLLLAAQLLRARIRLLRRLFLPGSIIAGTAALLLGPEVLGTLAGEGAGVAADGLVPKAVLEVWQGLPGLLINVVFAALFLGKAIPGMREMWYRAGPQVVFGQTLAWGQYVVGLTLTLLVLTPFFGMNAMAGALIEIGFEGGHGTAAGMAASFAELGFAEGADLALGLATVGIVGGVLFGVVLVNWAVRRGHIALSEEGDVVPVADPAGERAELDRLREENAESTEPLSLHIGIVAVAIGLGWLLHKLLIGLEALSWGRGGLQLMNHVPLFPLAMLGGVLIQLLVDRFGWGHHISRRLMNRISGAALDFTIVTALATLSLSAIGEHLLPFLLLAVAGSIWCLFCVLVLAPRLIPYNWFERGIGDFGQSMGVTTTGLLLMRMSDPHNRSGALESFGYKQLFFEPIVGGGLFTAASLPLIVALGPVAMLVFTAAVAGGWLVFGLWYFGPLARAERRRA